MSRKRKKTTKNKLPKIHVPEGLAALMTSQEIHDLRRRVNRRLGTCGICHKTLGRTKELAMIVAPHQLKNMETFEGSWQVTTTHRMCQKEQVLDTATVIPQHTYTTTLVALPIENVPGRPEQVPTLLVNPSVDHFALLKRPGGAMVDRTMHHLETKVGFNRMTPEATETPEPESLDAYVKGANVTVADNEAGISWTHEQQVTDAQTLGRLEVALRELLEGWDNTLLVMASTRFRALDPMQLMANLPKLLEAGHVYSAPATVQFKETNAALVDKAMAAATGMSANE